MKIDPLKYYFNKYGCDKSEIKRVEIGDRFIALVLNNKRLGISARYKGEITDDLSQFDKIDLDTPSHRTLLTAYYNAKYNTDSKFTEGADIIADIKEGNYSNVVMIGYFSSLIEKFKSQNIDVSVFDFNADDVIPLKYQKKYLSKADAVVMTSTTILNGTFGEMIEFTNNQADIFIVGPSSLLDKEIFQIANIKKIHGAIFNPEDENVISMIKEGCIPKEFLRFGKKVFLEK